MSHAHESGGEGARMAPRQRIERATGLLLVTAILVMPWAAVAQQPPSPPQAAPPLNITGGTGSPINRSRSVPAPVAI
jgi:hypothetical protein